MKTKTLDFWQALELFRLTEKPIPTIEKYQTYPDCREKSIERYLEGKFFGCVDTIEVPIPEGRNPDGLTLAHLQMGEDGEEYHIFDGVLEYPSDDVEAYIEGNWVKGYRGTEGYTYRTRKPKGWWKEKEGATKINYLGAKIFRANPEAYVKVHVMEEEKQPTLGDCLDDEGNEVYNIPDQPDLAQEFEELYNKEFNQANAAKAFINLHERLKRLEKGTE